MIEYKLSLASSGAVKAPGYEDMLRFGYNKNCGVYRLRVTAADEWKGMKLRVFWHTPEGDPPASLVENGVVEVPAFVTAVSGEGRITFEGSDGTRTITSADMRYRVAANSGTEDGTMPPLGTPAWQQLVGWVEEVGADARKSAEQARKSMKQAESEKSAAAGSAAAAAKKLKELQDGIAAGDFKGEKGDTGARGPQGNTGPQGKYRKINYLWIKYRFHSLPGNSGGKTAGTERKGCDVCHRDRKLSGIDFGKYRV